MCSCWSYGATYCGTRAEFIESCTLAKIIPKAGFREYSRAAAGVPRACFLNAERRCLYLPETSGYVTGIPLVSTCTVRIFAAGKKDERISKRSRRAGASQLPVNGFDTNSVFAGPTASGPASPRA